MAFTPPRPVLDPKTLRPETRLVHSGILRSQFAENSEALFLTQGYVYDEAETAEARFSGKEPGFVYSRYANPTIAMFESRLAALEGAEACRATASGMAAVTSAMLCLVRAGDHVVAGRALFGSCRYVIEDLLPRFGVATTLVDGTDLKAWEKAIRPNTRAFFFESPTNPTLEILDIAAIAKLAQESQGPPRGRQRLRHAGAAEPAQARRRCGGLFGDQAHRRPGPRARRRHPGLAAIDPGEHPQFPAPDRPVPVAVQCLGAAEGHRDARHARRAHAGEREEGRRLSREEQEREEGALPLPRRSPASTSSPRSR